MASSEAHRGLESVWARWWYAAKPKSWPKLLVPMALGQMLGAVVAETFSVGAFVFGCFFVIADLLTIVFLNDWADRDVDRIKREMFPHGCSPKTIPDGILPVNALLLAGLAAGLVGLIVAGGAARWLERPSLLGFSTVAILVFWAYTLPPIRLNYRGGGELLEGLGVGAVLPALNVYAQAGTLRDPRLVLLLPFVALSLASAVASGLADERSDRRGGKRTVATLLGNRGSRRIVESLTILGGIGWLAIAWGEPQVGVAGVLGGCTVFAFVPSLFSSSPKAVTDAFQAQGRYKLALHRAVWFGALATGAGLLLSA